MEGLVAFAAALGLVFVMELGDKTQIALVSLAARHPWRPVLAGGAVGLVAATAVGAVVGAAAYWYLGPATVALRLAGAALFIVLGLLTLRRKEREPAEPDAEAKGRGAFAAAVALTFLAEMGDKTQLTVIVLAGGEGAPLSVFVGASVALVAMAAVSVFLGKQLASRLKEETVRRVSAALFMIAGALLAVDTLGGL